MHAKHHRHDGHEFERWEGRLGIVASVVGVLIGLAMGVGLLFSHGHVTW
jgi:hypothetical protein